MASKKKDTDSMELLEAQDHDGKTKQRNTTRFKPCKVIAILFALSAISLALALSTFAVYIDLSSSRENTCYNTTCAKVEELQDEIQRVKKSLKALSTKVDNLEKSLETSQHSTKTEFSQVWDELHDLKSKIENQPKNCGRVKLLKNYLILLILLVFCLNLM